MLLANVVGKRFAPSFLFTGSCFLAGVSLFLAASMSSLPPGAFFVAAVGFFGAPGYSSGFTLMHQHVDDELRGRVFGALLTVIRICMVFSLALSPIVAGVAHKIITTIFPDAVIHFKAFSLNVAGVRVTLWMAGTIIAGSGLWAARRLQVSLRHPFAGRPPRPVAGELTAGVRPEDAFSADDVPPPPVAD